MGRSAGHSTTNCLTGCMRSAIRSAARYGSGGPGEIRGGSSGAASFGHDQRMARSAVTGQGRQAPGPEQLWDVRRIAFEGKTEEDQIERRDASATDPETLPGRRPTEKLIGKTKRADAQIAALPKQTGDDPKAQALGGHPGSVGEAKQDARPRLR